MKRLATFAFAALLFAPLAGRAADTYLPTTLSPTDVFKKNAAAAGDLAFGTYEGRSVSRGGGMEADFTSYYGGGDDITHVVRGPFVTAYGTYDGRGWDQDENGIVILDTGFHGKENPNAVAVAHPEDSANRVTMLGLTSTKPSQYAIDVNPPGGDHHILYYDAATFLLSRDVTLDPDGQKEIETYDDYRHVFGETVSFHNTYSDGHPENDSDERQVSFVRVTTPVDFNIPANRSLLSFSSTAPVSLPVRFVDGSIIVRATINGRGLDFLLDSGASTLTINPDVAHELGLTAYGRSSETIGGRFFESPTVVPDMAIGDLHMHDVAMEEVDVGEEHLGIQVVGLLGFDFISSGLLAIDFKKQTLTLYPPGSTIPNVGPLMRVPIELDDGIPRIPAAFNRVSGKFIMDTGSFATILFPQYFQQIHGGSIDEGAGVYVEFVGGVVPTRAFAMDRALFGPAQVEGLDVLVPETGKNGTGMTVTDYDGLLGRDLLRHYAIYLDYADHAVFLQPND
ncbi:MAG TPA: retropepsin-like aspartic protease [Candidatus Baltobacteraceae bacterium]